MKKVRLILIFLALNCSLLAQKLSQMQWLEDFEFIAIQLKENHPNVYYRISEEKFLESLNDTKEEIKNSKTDLESYFAIKRFIAKIQDGHTSISDKGLFGFTNLIYSFRAEKFSDGVFLTAVHKDYKYYFGAKIIEYNGLPIDEVLSLTSSLKNSDNEFGKISTSTYYLGFPKIMSGLLNINEEENLKMKVEDRNGKIEEVSFKVIHEYKNDDWLTITTELGDQTPLHLKNLIPSKKYYWFEHLQLDSAIYFQYNLVSNQSDYFETWPEFNTRLWNYIDTHENDINKLIIDVRYNTGGSGRTLYPFIDKIIEHTKFREGRNLFVLVGDETFSAPVILLNELKVHTNAIFIGIPPSHPFNFFSNREYLEAAPNTGIRLGVASRQIDNAWSSERDYFCPDIPAQFKSSDYFSGNDPGLEIALHYNNNLTLKDYAIIHGADDACEYSKKWLSNYQNYEWWYPLDSVKLENEINTQGIHFMNFGRMNEAFELLKLNTLLFPQGFNTWDSLAFWYYTNRDYENAKKYYQKSYELNHENNSAKRMIDKVDKIVANSTIK